MFISSQKMSFLGPQGKVEELTEYFIAANACEIHDFLLPISEEASLASTTCLRNVQ